MTSFTATVQKSIRRPLVVAVSTMCFVALPAASLPVLRRGRWCWRWRYHVPGRQTFNGFVDDVH